jgi:hypothetical protein
MKNEGPFILEWLAWHRAIGVQDFLIYTNDCTDGTDTFLMLLQTRASCSTGSTLCAGRRVETPARRLAGRRIRTPDPECRLGDLHGCGRIHQHQAGRWHLPTLYAAMEAALPGANMISLTWRLFGNGDVDGI